MNQQLKLHMLFTKSTKRDNIYKLCLRELLNGGIKAKQPKNAIEMEKKFKMLP